MGHPCSVDWWAVVGAWSARVHLCRKSRGFFFGVGAHVIARVACVQYPLRVSPQEVFDAGAHVIARVACASPPPVASCCRAAGAHVSARVSCGQYPLSVPPQARHCRGGAGAHVSARVTCAALARPSSHGWSAPGGSPTCSLPCRSARAGPGGLRPGPAQ